MGHERVLELPEGMDTARSKTGVPSPGSLAERGGKADAEKSVGCPLDRHESFIALQMVNQVGEAII